MSSVRRLILALALAALAGGQAGPAVAADSATVDVDVTVATPCVLATTTSVSFGALPFTPEAFSQTGSGNATIGYESCSGADESVFVHGTDASGTGASWILSHDAFPCQNPELNLYHLAIRSTHAPINFALSTTDQSLETAAAGATGAADRLQIQMPCVGADGAGETMSFHVVLTATF